MRRAVEWTVYPRDQVASPYVVIQSVTRIARIDLTRNVALLSHPRKGNAFRHLAPARGAVEVPVDPDLVARLRGLDLQPQVICKGLS